MRILHTSDWHLGQVLHHFDRHYEHQCFLDWLIQTLVEQHVDVLLIAGDIFDNANPSAAAQQQFYQFLSQVHERLPSLNIVLIAGNHDSPGRLEAPLSLLSQVGAVVVGQVRRLPSGELDLDSLLVPLKNRSGQVQAWCLAVPFLRPADLPKVAGDNSYAAGVAALYQQVLARVHHYRRSDQAIIALGHCHMHGGAASEHSERRIVVGGSEALPVNLFSADIAYAALGHLHLAQTVGGHSTRRYCGSPIPLSFAETRYRHQVLLVELQAQRVEWVEPLYVPRFVELWRLPSEPSCLEDALAVLAALPEASDTQPQADWPYLEVRVQLSEPEPGLRHRIEAALVGKAVRLARIDVSRPTISADTEEATQPAVSLEQLDQLQPDSIFQRLYEQHYQEAVPDKLHSAFAELIDEVQLGDAE